MIIDEDREVPLAGSADKMPDLSRRQLLRGATFAAGCTAFLASTLATQRAEAKMAQKAALYQETPKDGKQCANCTLFVAPSSCKIVDGTISPNGYCRFFVAKS